MTIATLIVLGFIALLWLWLASSRAHRANFAGTLDAATIVPITESARPVFVIVPARNEADTLPHTIPSICRQEYPNLRLILVDDQSDDGSDRVLERLAREHRNLTVVRGKDRPDGWMGKCWAVQQGVESIADLKSEISDLKSEISNFKSPIADEAMLLFTDADINFHPRAVAQAAGYLHTHQLDALSLFPRITFGQPIEALAMAGLVTMLGCMFPLGWVNDPKRATALAAGGFFMIRSSAYRAVGGHACVKSQLIEDVNLARQLKARGAKLHCQHTRDLVSTRMYDGFADTWEGLAKNAYAGMEYQPHKFWVGLIVGLLVAVLPPVYLIVTILWAVRARTNASWTALALACVINICIVIVHARTTRHLKLPWYHALFMPISAALYTLIAATSFWQHHFGGGNVWKGRRYRREMLLAPAEHPR
jgi:hopene-associated glycosyltransferase HpnB